MYIYIYIYIYIICVYYKDEQKGLLLRCSLFLECSLLSANFDTKPSSGDFFFGGQAVRVFANWPGDLGSITGRVIPKTQKMVLDASLMPLSIIRYGSRVK